MNATPPDEFLPPEGFTPHVRTPGWIVYAPLSPQAHAVAGYLYGHVNPDDGTFTVIPSHAKIAKYLGVKTENSARKYVNELKDAGVLDAITTFWDRKAQRRTTQRVRDDGINNDQTSNSYRLRWAPPKGRLHPGPMNSGEWHHPDKIQQRITAETARWQSEEPTPLQHSEGGGDQQKQEFSQVEPPLNSVHPPPSTELGGPPHTVEDEEEQEEKNNFQPTTAGDHESSPTESSGHDNGWLEGSAKDENDGGPDQTEGESGPSGQTNSTHTAEVDTSAGALLLHRIERQNTAHLNGPRAQYIRTINDALAVLTRDIVAHHLGEGLATANTPPGALVDRIRGLPQKVADQQAQQTQRAERGQRGTEQPATEASTRWQRRETPDELMQALGGDGAFVPSRFRNRTGDAA